MNGLAIVRRYSERGARNSRCRREAIRPRQLSIESLIHPDNR